MPHNVIPIPRGSGLHEGEQSSLDLARPITDRPQDALDGAVDFKMLEPLDALPISKPKRLSPSKVKQSDDGRREAGHARPADLAEAAIKIRRGLRKGVEGIIEAALDLDNVKQQKLVKRGQFTTWVKNEVGVNIRTGEWLINIARDPVLTKPCHRHALPPSIRTMYELSRIKSPEEKERLIAAGEINRTMVREEAIALRWRTQIDPSLSITNKTPGRGSVAAPVLEPKPETAILLDVCVERDGGDVVNGFLRRQKRTRKASPTEFEQAAGETLQWLINRRGEKL